LLGLVHQPGSDSNSQPHGADGRHAAYQVITQREGCYDKRLTRAAHMLEMALEGFFDDEDDRAVLPFPDEYPAA
jgi:hypothetical protein